MKIISHAGNNSNHLYNIALFAGIFEWYEFALYGLMSAALGPLFFNTDDRISTALSVYIVFALSYLARPLGGIFFGRMGDTVNHGRALKLSLMTMAVPTAIIGFLPTYASAGLWATSALCTLRLVQGFGVGGEFPNSIAYVFNTSSQKERTFLGSITCASTSLGMLLGSTVVSSLNWYFTKAEILDWAWRIPFLLSIPLTLFIAFIRRSIIDPTWQNRSTTQRSMHSLWQQVIKARTSLFKMILLGGMLTTCSNLLLIWMPFYLQTFLNIPPHIASTTNTITLIVEITVLVSSGYMMYQLPVEKLLKYLHIGLLLAVYPLFFLLQYQNVGLLILSQCTLAFFLGSINACFIEMMGRVLPKEIRSISTSIIFAVSPAIFGGLAPLTAIWLIKTYHLLTAPAFLILGISIIAAPVTFSFRAIPKLPYSA